MDRTTKVLLAAIALGLWANAIGDWLRVSTIEAQDLALVEAALLGVQTDVAAISNGSCSNPEICQSP